MNLLEEFSNVTFGSGREFEQSLSVEDLKKLTAVLGESYDPLSLFMPKITGVQISEPAPMSSFEYAWWRDLFTVYESSRPFIPTISEDLRVWFQGDKLTCVSRDNPSVSVSFDVYSIFDATLVSASETSFWKLTFSTGAETFEFLSHEWHFCVHNEDHYPVHNMGLAIESGIV